MDFPNAETENFIDNKCITENENLKIVELIDIWLYNPV